MEPESRVLTAGEMLRWMLLAAVLALGIGAYFIFGREAAPFHQTQIAPGIELHR